MLFDRTRYVLENFFCLELFNLNNFSYYRYVSTEFEKRGKYRKKLQDPDLHKG
jgi:hypothetical protein